MNLRNVVTSEFKISDVSAKDLAVAQYKKTQVHPVMRKINKLQKTQQIGLHASLKHMPYRLKGELLRKENYVFWKTKETVSGFHSIEYSY